MPSDRLKILFYKPKAIILFRIINIASKDTLLRPALSAISIKQEGFHKIQL